MSKISICNQALGWLGANLITSFEDGTTESNLCNSNYDPLRDAVLEQHNWTFATTWEELVMLANPPISLYPNSFQIPTDALAVTFCGIDYDHPVRWRREGSAIVTDESRCVIQYIRRVEDEAQFTPLFTQALAARIAADLAIPLTDNRTLQSDMFQLYQVKVKEAASRDNMQGRSRRIRSRWLNRAGSSSSAGPVV